MVGMGRRDGRATRRHSGRSGPTHMVKAAGVLGMMLSEGEVLVIVVITAVIVFVIARKRK